MDTTQVKAPKGAEKAAPKAAPKAKAKKASKGFTGIKQGIYVILACAVLAVCIYLFVFGYLGHFQGGDKLIEEGKLFSVFAGDAELSPADLIGTVYKGGFVVPIIWTLLFSVIAFAIERFFAIRTAYGKEPLAKFVEKIKAALSKGEMEKAQQICDKQQGSVANVVRSTLNKYIEMDQTDRLTKEQKLLAIRQELEEATALEMPMLQENMPIIGTIVSLGTLTGLLGTVLGMIRSFGAMNAGEGGADSAALATGISEALVNTASGIATGAVATIAYNYFTNKIDRLTFSLDEVGFSIVETFNATH